MDDNVAPSDVADITSNLLQLSKEDICNMTFESEDEAFRFYNSYAYATGFSVRRDSVLRKRPSREVLSRSFVCSCQGSRKKVYLEMSDRQREHRALTRCDCMARLRIKFNQENLRYVVTNFVEEHSHDLVPMYGVSQLRSHRHAHGHMVEAHAMPNVGLTPRRVMEMLCQNIGFTRKDLYDKIEEFGDEDAKVALAYLYGKSDCDPMFFFQHSVGVDNKLDKLLWIDGRSREEYAVFGDVLIFDATYKTNAYKLPLVILAGANNHRNTCIFGAALVQNDSIDSYVWVLKTFLSVMDDKRPLSVVTDGDKSMHAAISEVLPEVQHKLCRYRLQRDVISNVKADNFSDAFNRLVTLKCSIDDFEDAWRKMVVHYGFENHKWIAEIYETRHMWADAFLRGHFFALVKSTRRCEGMSAFLNKLSGSEGKLVDFIRAYHRGLERIRTKAINQEVKTNYTKPVITTALKDLEEYASKVYTRAVFKKLKKQIELQAALWHEEIVSHSVSSRTYVVADWNDKELLRHVSFDKEGPRLKCDCKRFESSGMLCDHMIYVLKCEGLREIPPSCINERWTADISKNFRDKNLSSATIEEVEIARQAYIISKCSEMAFYAKKTSQGYKEAIDVIERQIKRSKELWTMNVNASGNAAA